jgi:hypothetical protein
MAKHEKSPRERAARALCRLSGNPENAMFEGEPMWKSFLDEVDTVLIAALSEEEWRRIRAIDPPDPE